LAKSVHVASSNQKGGFKPRISADGERKPMSSKTGKYKVGYGKPPVEYRWKKGRSGNPQNKRKKRGISTAAIVEGYFLKEVDVLKGESLQRITIFEAIISKLYQEELAGNKKAARARLKYFEFAASKREKQEIILVNVYQPWVTKRHLKRNGGGNG
jgi:hypothetical protein